MEWVADTARVLGEDDPHVCTRRGAYTMDDGCWLVGGAGCCLGMRLVACIERSNTASCVLGIHTSSAFTDTVDGRRFWDLRRLPWPYPTPVVLAGYDLPGVWRMWTSVKDFPRWMMHTSRGRCCIRPVVNDLRLKVCLSRGRRCVHPTVKGAYARGARCVPR